MQSLRTLLLFLILCITGSVSSQEVDKNVIVKKVFEVLKNKNEDGFVQLFPDRKTFISYFEKIIKDTSEAAPYLNEIATDSLYEIQYREDFERAIKMGEEKGVDWEKSEFVKSVIDSALINEEDFNYPSLKGKIYFTVNRTEFFLSFSSIIYFEGKGWYGVDIEKIDLTSKEKNTDDDWDGL